MILSIDLPYSRHNAICCLYDDQMGSADNILSTQTLTHGDALTAAMRLEAIHTVNNIDCRHIMKMYPIDSEEIE